MPINIKVCALYWYSISMSSFNYTIEFTNIRPSLHDLYWDEILRGRNNSNDDQKLLNYFTDEMLNLHNNRKIEFNHHDQTELIWEQLFDQINMLRPDIKNNLLNLKRLEEDNLIPHYTHPFDVFNHNPLTVQYKRFILCDTIETLEYVCKIHQPLTKILHEVIEFSNNQLLESYCDSEGNKLEGFSIFLGD